MHGKAPDDGTSEELLGLEEVDERLALVHWLEVLVEQRVQKAAGGKPTKPQELPSRSQKTQILKSAAFPRTGHLWVRRKEPPQQLPKAKRTRQ